ncbi:non-specific serine/threonine protein kinase [Lewinella aquimaris]|uniref:Non-specific serine/threonine protein kinase n=1 Tax=Neolewinella aquimaris TaxID=1835722 RepID=A0A840EBD3_9BACT|nr:DEAD/DEAH box helicase [Neolewinella aquimaris]MBB4081002.1 non-specific serine/threonine protein kinase [Neolewinella aquimaris]
MQSAILFNFFEFRTGFWLPKAYVCGIDRAGRPQVVHQAAKRASLQSYGIAAVPELLHALELAESLREKSLVEHFRRGSKKTPSLAGLIREESKERAAVLQYVHARTTALLQLCRQTPFRLALNLDVRSSPTSALVDFDHQPWKALLSFTLTEEGMHYRLRLRSADREVHLVRHLDPRILTNRPAPGWIATGRRLFTVAGLRGDALRPFLTRDEVRIPLSEVGRYLRKFVSRAAVGHDIEVQGFDYLQIGTPSELTLTARPHPFDQIYHLYASFTYGEVTIPAGDPEEVKVTYTVEPPFRLVRVVRDRREEERLLLPLREMGVREVTGTAALTVADDAGAFGNLAWLLRNHELLSASGVTVAVPDEGGHPFTLAPASLEVSAEETGDWLDLRGTVTVGDHRMPFVQLIRYIQRGERRVPLPNGELFLVPEEWLASYGPALQLARVNGKSVRMARSQAPALRQSGVVATGYDREGDELAAAYHPPEQLRANLRPYQLTGVRWLIKHYHQRLGACLADDMGLGKTLQTIAVLLYAKQNLDTADAPPAGQIELFGGPASDESFLNPLRALVILPASLVYNWSAELRKFAPSLTVCIQTGTKRTRDPRILRRSDVILTTYHTALRDKAILSEIGLSYIVLDESQQIKNRKSKVFRMINDLEATHRISLSGTPIENSLSDLWSQMQFINPGVLRSYPFFKKAFVGPIEVHDDELKKAQLRQLVGPYLLRRTKAEVAPDLPELDVQVFYCEMTAQQRRQYERERSAARNTLLGAPAPETGHYKLLVIQTLTRLRQIANHPVIADPDYSHDSGKFAEAFEQWNTIRRSGQKVLIFSSMVRFLELFRDHVTRLGQPYAWITGSVDSAQRAREVERFQHDPTVQTFLISIKAGGTGLNLTAADYVFILDPWWNPTVEDQAIARAHRIGRRGNVFARKFLSQGTLEEKIHRLQQRKKRLADEIIGGEDQLQLDRGELDFLLSPGDATS